MLKKLTDQKQEEIIDAGIAEFAERGMQNASMNSIAKRAGISVGVLYKYYENKDDFFLACLKKSLSMMENTVESITLSTDDPLDYARHLIHAVQHYSHEHPEYIRMYHEITSSGTHELAAELAQHIEGMTSRTYTELVSRAQRAGVVNMDLDPALFAMFMDNLLMMMQFTYCCPYYNERYKIYRGVDIFEEDEFVADQLLKFLARAFK